MYVAFLKINRTDFPNTGYKYFSEISCLVIITMVSVGSNDGNDSKYHSPTACSSATFIKSQKLIFKNRPRIRMCFLVRSQSTQRAFHFMSLFRQKPMYFLETYLGDAIRIQIVFILKRYAKFTYKKELSMSRKMN